VTPPDIARIPIPTPFAVGAVNAYLLGGDPLTLVDAGPRMEEAEAFLDAALAEHGVAIEDLDLIVLTHQHADHVGLAAQLQRRSGAAVAATARLAAFLGDIEQSLEADDAYAVALLRRHGVGEDTIDTLSRIVRAFRRFTEGAAVTHVLEPGGELVAGGRSWTVAERPGHSPTDTVLRADGLLLGGDHLLEKISSNPIAHVAIGAPDPAGLAASPDRPQPLVTYLESMRRTAEEDRGDRVLPGHGAPFTGAAALVEKRAAMTARRAEKIRRALARARTAADVGRELWRHVPVTQAYLVLSEVLGHLDLLERRGAVRQVTDGAVVRWERT
jgi:glyoxylase-like metal-dependent hydrolase (beta-lactamase superfamily II)